MLVASSIPLMGCGASAASKQTSKYGVKGDPAPYLSRYFAKLEQIAEARSSALEKMLEPAEEQDRATFDQIRKDWEAEEAKMFSSLKAIIASSVAHHDADCDGVLQASEADVFFNHFIQRFVDFQAKKGFEVLAEEMKFVPVVIKSGCPDMITGEYISAEIFTDSTGVLLSEKEMRSALSDRGVTAKKEITEKCENQRAKYQANTESLNRAAFEVVDKKKNHTLEEDALVSALTPETDQYYALLVALELLTAEEAVKQAKVNLIQELSQNPALWGDAEGKRSDELIPNEIK